MKQLRKTIDVNVEITQTGYSAYCEILPNETIYTTGETLEQLKRNIVESANFLLEEKSAFITENTIAINVDLTEFFEFHKLINSRYLAQRIGMNPTLLSQYVNGKKTPSKRQKLKILNGMKSVGAEISTLNFK